MLSYFENKYKQNHVMPDRMRRIMEEGREKPGAASKPPRVKNNRQTPRAQAVLFPYCGSTSMGAFFAAARSRLRPRHQRDRLCASHSTNGMVRNATHAGCGWFSTNAM